MSEAQTSKQRTSFTDIERQSLRAQRQQQPGSTPLVLASWFEQHFGRRITTSSVYDILSDRYAYLDNTEATNTTRKQRGPQWQELEAALYKWWQGEQPREVTGTELKSRANQLWQTLSACQEKKMPSFSDGWLSKWRNRHGLSQPKRAAKSIPITDCCIGVQSTTAIDFSILGLLPVSQPAATHHEINHNPLLAIDFRHTSHFPPLSDSIVSLHHQEIDGGFDYQRSNLFRKRRVHDDGCLKSTPEIHGNDERRKKRRLIQESCTASTYSIFGCQEAAYRHVVANSSDTQRYIAHKSSERVNLGSWKDIMVLASKFSSQTAHDVILPAKRVIDVFEPIITDAQVTLDLGVSDLLQEACYWEKRYKGRLAQSTSEVRKAIAVWRASGLFKLVQPSLVSHETKLEDWFLEFLSPEILRSGNPELYDDVRKVPAQGIKGSKKAGNRHSIIGSTVRLIEGGRVDVISWNYSNNRNLSETDIVEEFHASITITPPASAIPTRQTVFQLGMHTNRQTSMLLTPIMSFRIMRSNSDEIFEISEYGTSEELQMLLFKGEASLRDCDEDGRSLINYALQGKNTSTLKYLLTKVVDVDAYEADTTRQLLPLLGLLADIDFCLGVAERHRRAECTKLMLDFGADPSLPLPNPRNTSIFHDALRYASTATCQLMLDKGQPFISVNESVDHFCGPNPLLFLAFHLASIWLGRLAKMDKIHLLLERGADTEKCNKHGENCLIIVFRSISLSQGPYDEDSFKDVLMSVITAGADINACDNTGTSVSGAVIEANAEELWIEVLTECGYDPEPVLDSLHDHYHGKNPCYRVFAAFKRPVRSTKLSFKEYGKQRESLPWVRIEGEENEELKDWKEWMEFMKNLIKESYHENEDIYGHGFLSNDFMATKVCGEEYREQIHYDEDAYYEDNNLHAKAEDIYSTEHGQEWWL